MRSVAVVVPDILMDDGFKMSTTEAQHPVQTFTSDGADEALGKGIGQWCPDRGTDDPDSFSLKDLAEV